jgi:hypothetical protein
MFSQDGKHTLTITLSNTTTVTIWIDDALPRDRSWPTDGPPYVEVTGVEGVTCVGEWIPKTSFMEILSDCEIQLASTDDASARIAKAQASSEPGYGTGFAFIV